MPDLLIADPPHEPGDLTQAAELLGLAVAELRLKINYSVPEIWFADTSSAKVEEAADVLGRAGLHVARVPDRALAAVPDAIIAMESGIGHDGLTLATDTERGTLAPARTALLVAFSAQSPAPADAPPARADPYWFEDGLRRWRMTVGATALRGMGDGQSGSQTGELLRFVGECEARLSRATVDRRSVNMKLRHRWRRGPVPTGGPQRKGYSYASPGLDALLAGIEPGLEELDQPELTSRLAFLTWGARM